MTYSTVRYRTGTEADKICGQIPFSAYAYPYEYDRLQLLVTCRRRDQSTLTIVTDVRARPALWLATVLVRYCSRYCTRTLYSTVL